MKKLITLSQIICIGLLVMSCGDDEPANVSPEKAKEAFSSASLNAMEELSNFKEAPGYTAMESLSNLNSTANPFGRMKSVKPHEAGDKIKIALSSFRSIMQSSTENGRISGDEPFNYELKVGVYEYNSESGEFDKTGTSTIIKILFPTEGSLTNNAEFQLTDYDEVVDDYGYYNPKVIKATLKVDGVLQAKIDFAASYNNDDALVKADIYLYLNPYTIDFLFDDSGSNSTKLTFSLLNGSKTILGAGITVTYTSKVAGELSRVSGYAQLMNVRFEADISQNSQSIVVKVNGGKAGTIIFDDYGDAYIKYNDGTSEPFDAVFGALIDEFNALDLDVI